ncbi:hypothetical protein DFS34DRAFT_590559 [Phlyctochytrium arcticum]|nr:hypothetical protein DFS34DRAFT_590559 [Phlyctochytrium arcticum]
MTAFMNIAKSTMSMREDHVCGTPRSGALVHTICLRLYEVISIEFVATDPRHQRLLHEGKLLWNSRGQPCVQYREWSTATSRKFQHQTLDLHRGLGRVRGITYGTERSSKQRLVFDQDIFWMLARLDRFPPPQPWSEGKPVQRAPASRGSILERLPAETLTLLLKTILYGPDTPSTNARTLIALAGSSKCLRYHLVTAPGLWIQLCSQSEYLPHLTRCDLTPSADDLYTAIRDDWHGIYQGQSLSNTFIANHIKYDWMAYYVQAAKSPAMRNRRRICNICEQG